MTRFVSLRSLRSRWLPLAALVMGLSAISLAAPTAARADHDDHWEHRWGHYDHDDWRWHRGYYGRPYYVAPRYYAGWGAPVFAVAPPPPVYVVPAVPRYVVAPPPVVVVPPLPRIVLPLGHHGAVIFGP